MTHNFTVSKSLFNQHLVRKLIYIYILFGQNLTFYRVEEYHGQLHHHGDDDHEDENMETEQHDGKFQPVSDAKMMRLGRMIKDLRTRVPISAEAPGEKTTIPDTPEVNKI